MALTADGNAANGRLQCLAGRVRSQMQRLQISAAELARRCEKRDFPGDETRPNLSRERITKILMNAQPRVGKGAAKVVSAEEVFMLAETLEVSKEWLTGQTKYTNAPVLWDMASEPEISQQIQHLINHYEEVTGGSLIWAENLLCSLTPTEFVRGYYESFFSELDEIGLHNEKQNLVATYENFGNRQRRRMLQNTAHQKWTRTQIIFLSELEKIVRGDGHYSDIKFSIRRKCLENVRNLTADDSFGVRLIVARDEDAPHIKHLLRDYDRFGVNGDKFTLWCYHSGKVGWSENKNQVFRHRKIIDELIERSAYRERAEVSALLLQLRERTEKKPV